MQLTIMESEKRQISVRPALLAVALIAGALDLVAWRSAPSSAAPDVEAEPGLVRNASATLPVDSMDAPVQ